MSLRPDSGRPMTWHQLWCVEEGDVNLRSAWSFDDDPDWLCFEHPLRMSIDVDEEPHMVHIDALFEGRGVFIDKDDAEKFAVAWLEARIRVYQMRVATLRTKG